MPLNLYKTHLCSSGYEPVLFVAEFSMYNRDAGLHALVPLLLVVMLVDVIVLLLMIIIYYYAKKNDDDDEL